MGIEGLNRLKAWVKARIAAHTAISAAHHVAYTDADAKDAVFTAVHACKCKFLGDWYCPNTTVTYPVWNDEDFDYGNMLDLASHSNRITIRKNGVYFMIAKLYFLHPNLTTGNVQARIFKNGVYTDVVDYSVVYTYATNIDCAVQIFGITEASTNDYYSIAIYQSSGGDYKVSKKYSIFAAYLVRET